MTRPVRWLHISDLHMGCRGPELWWQVHSELEESVRDHARRLGAPDLVLFTGDLANTGDPAEYELVDAFLAGLRGWLLDEHPGCDPLLLAVPGNHDVRRPADDDLLPYQTLDKCPEGADDRFVAILNKKLWEQRDPALILPLFAGYQSWFERTVEPALATRAARYQRSHFPGDFSAHLEIPGAFPLTVVGLNSTWQQYREGDFERNS